jgi:hypothetical protein
VKEARPALRWSPCPDAARYRLLLARLGEPQPLAEWEGTATNWTPTKPLPRGTPLIWEVHALDSAGRELGLAPQSRFLIASEKQSRRIERATGPLARARALAEAGLFAEARAALEPLPDSAEKRGLIKALEGR